MKLKSILAAALCAVGLAAFAKELDGSETAPWSVGSDVTAWTNGTGKLTIEGSGETWPDFRDKVPGWASVTDPITSVEIGEGVTSIGAYAFCRGIVGDAFCLHLASVKLPSTLTNIGKQAFAECAALTAITLPEGLQTVGLAAFALCSLADVTIPASVGLIGGQAFYGQGLQLDSHVHTLKSVTVLATKPSILGPIAFDAHAEDFVIHVPAGTAADYRAADGWNQYAKWIDDGTGPASIFPNGDGGKFVPAAKGTVTYNGAVIAADGVAGTVTLKMSKPNKRTGLFNVTATVKTADGQKLSFKVKGVKAPADGGPLTVTLAGTNKKSKAHTLTVTLEGNSLKGSFDRAVIDGASDAFKDKASLRALAIVPFVGTWTGAFTSGLSTFSAKVKANGKATVKVVLPNGKIVSCSAKAEVGDGVIAVPVTVRKSVKGAVVTFGFRLAFGTVDGKFVCEAADVTPLKAADKKTGAVIESTELEFLGADRLTVTSKEFKAFAVKLPENLTKEFGEPTNLSLKMASTGLISGSIKFGKVKAKASGVVIGGKGVGLLTVTQKAGDQVYEFSAEAAK